MSAIVDVLTEGHEHIYTWKPNFITQVLHVVGAHQVRSQALGRTGSLVGLRLSCMLHFNAHPSQLTLEVRRIRI